MTNAVQVQNGWWQAYLESLRFAASSSRTRLFLPVFFGTLLFYYAVAYLPKVPLATPIITSILLGVFFAFYLQWLAVLNSANSGMTFNLTNLLRPKGRVILLVVLCNIGLFSIRLMLGLLGAGWGYYIQCLVGLVLFVVLSPFAELVYIKDIDHRSIFRSCWEFIRKHGIVWLAPYFILAILFYGAGGIGNILASLANSNPLFPPTLFQSLDYIASSARTPNRILPDWLLALTIALSVAVFGNFIMLFRMKLFKLLTRQAE